MCRRPMRVALALPGDDPDTSALKLFFECDRGFKHPPAVALEPLPPQEGEPREVGVLSVGARHQRGETSNEARPDLAVLAGHDRRLLRTGEALVQREEHQVEAPSERALIPISQDLREILRGVEHSRRPFELANKREVLVSKPLAAVNKDEVRLDLLDECQGRLSLI